MKPEVMIIGAGLAGLSCARALQEQGRSFRIVEASDAVGGRLRTDQCDGFLLDRGFQVFLSSYPEPKRWLDMNQLQLRPFLSGARVRYRGRFYDLADPWRRPWTAMSSMLSPIGTPLDKLRVARLRWLSLRGNYAQRMQRREQTTHDYLKELGFTDRMLASFLRPFLGGIFLDSQLQTSSRMLSFVFGMFSTGDACLPARGMQSIAEQMAAHLPQGSIQLNTAVQSLHGTSVVLQSGEQIECQRIVIAVDGPNAQRLLPNADIATAGNSVRCLYFAADHAPFPEPILVLSGDAAGPINNLAIPTNVTPSYSQSGESLISVTVLDDKPSDEQLPVLVRAQLRDWYGQQVDTWRHLRSYTIPYALPDQRPPALSPPQRPVQIDDYLFVCGDHRDNASIEGALVSGRRAAEAVSAVCARQTRTTL